jgi:AcrR family transcriptional regulator
MAQQKMSRLPATRPGRGASSVKSQSAGSRRSRTSVGRGAAPSPAVADAVLARRDVILREAAQLFGEKGYENTSMRDIAAAYGILPGSLYHHFRSKDELFVAVYAAGIDEIIDAVEKATRDEPDPWRRLEAACEAHLTTLLDRTGHAAVVIASWPSTSKTMHEELVRQRDRYERIFRRLADAAPLPSDVDRTVFRLGLLGALNWALTWYRPGGSTPAALARKLVRLFRRS